jgi:GAF domain-containing protein/HAMP domain-containing protein
MQSDAYLKMQEKMFAIRATSPDIAYLYVLRKNEQGKIEFIIDAGDEPSLLREVYDDASDTLVSNFDSMVVPIVEEDIYSDKWGDWLTGYVPAYTSDGQERLIIAMDLTASSVLERERQFLVISLGAFFLVIPLAAIAGWFLGRALSRPILKLTEGAHRISVGDLSFQANIRTGDEREELAEAINTMARRLREMVEGLEMRIQERTQEVETRSKYLEAASEVGRAATTMLDADQLAKELVEQIRNNFNMYYVGLFLLDETKTWAILRAGTGEAGQKLLARGHRRKVGEGMIGWCVANNQARVASVAQEDLQRVSTLELPDTRSELALPLRSRGQVLGALTVQSDRANAFNEQFVSVLQTMADQVAVALDNARLFSDSRTAVTELERANRELNRQTWFSIVQQLGSGNEVIYQADEQGVKRRDLDFELLPHGEEEHQPKIGQILSLPIQVRGTTLGYIQAEKPLTEDGQNQEWTDEEKTLIQALVEQLGIALENARLYSTTQQSAARERILSEITGKVRASTSVSTILQTAVQELAVALRLPGTAIQLRAIEHDESATK